MKNLLIFTDLDGTLLDHESYSWAAAKPALAHIRREHIPLIINSSKTKAEICAIRKELDNHDPFIVENGGAICVPQGYFADLNTDEAYYINYFGPKREAILALLQALRASEGYTFKGFFDYSIEQLAALTGLSPEGARRAKMKLCSEPIQWLDSDKALEAFKHKLHERGLKLLEGGRFFHVMGQFGKGDGIKWLHAKYQAAHPDAKFLTLALGDGPNDQDMLEAADIAVVIEPAKGEPLRLERKEGALYPGKKGPEGWQAAMEYIFQLRL